jgi:hypothetical protein
MFARAGARSGLSGPAPGPWLGLWLATAAVACVRTPDLVFLAEDAGVDAASEVADAAAAAEAGDAAADVRDAREAEPEDAGPVNTCPTELPPGVDLCCGKQRCAGNACDAAGRCDLCRVACNAREVCCAHNNATQCRPFPEQCP